MSNNKPKKEERFGMAIPDSPKVKPKEQAKKKVKKKSDSDNKTKD